ncbi:non-hydrolyzing UDP-N-acetylglucosamine 2-epimerase [Chloroflexota bacterium]
MKITIILGTRPEIVKMSPVVKELQRKKTDFFILHTGQHYSSYLDKVFFDQLELPQPKYNIKVGSGSHAEETGKMLIEMEQILLRERPDIALVEGDTNSVLAGALVASKLHIIIGHIEAGLRSYDKSMPEEINRVLVDHISDYLFAPTEMARGILLGEGIPERSIFVTGNTIVDAVYLNLKIADSRANILQELSLEPKKYLLATVHRQENVDDMDRFGAILEGLKRISETFNLPLVYPVHPRSKKRIEEFNLQHDGIRLIPPLDFLDFLKFEANACLVLTDSGGVQEESCILGVPCVTLRDNTERPETLEVGANILAGVTPEEIVGKARIMIDRKNNWSNPFGDGRAGGRIVEILMECC